MLKNILSASPVGISYFENGKIKWTNQAMAEASVSNVRQITLEKAPENFTRPRKNTTGYVNSSMQAFPRADSLKRTAFSGAGRIDLFRSHKDQRPGSIQSQERHYRHDI